MMPFIVVKIDELSHTFSDALSFPFIYDVMTNDAA